MIAYKSNIKVVENKNNIVGSWYTSSCFGVFAAVSFAHQFTYQILGVLILFVQCGIRVFHQKSIFCI